MLKIFIMFFDICLEIIYAVAIAALSEELLILLREWLNRRKP